MDHYRNLQSATSAVKTRLTLAAVKYINYLGVTIIIEMEYAYQHICTKTNRSLGFLRRILFSRPQDEKEAAPALEYGCSVWDTHTKELLQDESEKVHNRAARFVTRTFVYETESMTDILGQWKWESLKKRRKDNRFILLYENLKGKARIHTDDLILKIRRCRNQHSMVFQIPFADAYKIALFLGL